MKRNILARMHNEGIIYCLNKCQGIPSSEDSPKSVESLVKEFCIIHELPYAPSNLPAFPKGINDLDLGEWVEQITFSDEFKKLVNSTLGILEQNYSIFETFNKLDVLLEQAKSTLSENEFPDFEDHIYVAKRSIEFWLSEIDGIRVWKLNAPCLKDIQEKAPINWWKVLGCDCVGGLFNGPAGYICASVISVIMQL